MKKQPKKVQLKFTSRRKTPTKSRRKIAAPRKVGKRLKTTDRAKMPLRKFCGKKGGAAPRTYPVDTPGRAKIAIAYAYKAPNPQGIVDCAKRALARMKKQGLM